MAFFQGEIDTYSKEFRQLEDDSSKSNLKIKAERMGGNFGGNFPSKYMGLALFHSAAIVHGLWS